MDFLIFQRAVRRAAPPSAFSPGCTSETAVFAFLVQTWSTCWMTESKKRSRRADKVPGQGVLFCCVLPTSDRHHASYVAQVRAKLRSVLCQSVDWNKSRSVHRQQQTCQRMKHVTNNNHKQHRQHMSTHLTVRERRGTR